MLQALPLLRQCYKLRGAFVALCLPTVCRMRTVSCRSMRFRLRVVRGTVGLPWLLLSQASHE